jgi:tRNA(adenine34) deaminase
MLNFNKINYNMSLAIDQAYLATKQGEVPVGAILIDSAGKLVADTHNTKEMNNDPCQHAEILAISEGAKQLKNWRLSDCELFVTLEPCAMCMGAIIHSRIKAVYFGAYDTKAGSISLGFNIHQHQKLNHRVNVYGGFKHLECSKQLSDFFRGSRRR